MRQVYLDYAASTPMKKEVLEVMLPYMTEYYGNASSVHSFGRKLQQTIEQSRRSLGRLLNCKSEEIYFLSGGTEANNWAIKGIARKYQEKGKHILISEIEHPAVLNTAAALKEEGFDIEYIAVNEEGIITLEAVTSKLRQDTILCSVMYVNNEIGTIQPIKAIGKVLRDKGVFFHTDAVQAFGYMPIDLQELNVDMMTISSHKIYGPTGIGALYIKKGTKIKSLLDGGAQERSRRAGTHHAAGIIGFSKAAELRYENLEDNIKNLKKKRDYLLKGLMSIGDMQVNGSLEQRHPGSLNITFKGIDGDTLLMNLDLLGIAVSAGSACSSGAVDASHVLLALGLSKKEAKASIRLSVGDYTSTEDLDYVIDKLREIINRLRG